MSRERDQPHPTDAFGLPEGLLAAIVCALLLEGLFVLASSATPMPPAERWAALTTFTLLALGTTLPGCAALYDALGRAVRRDWRAFAALAALIPALYLAYALAVRELSASGIGAAVLFAAVPALAFTGARGSRAPHLLDAVALGYLFASLTFGLLPQLSLPQQGGLVGFFRLAAVPLLLLLYAWRGWPGLGFTWHLSWRELRDALLAALAGAAAIYAGGRLIAELTPPLYLAQYSFSGNLLGAAISAYFFTALPAELLFRGGVQNGLTRVLRGRLGAAAPWLAIAVAAALSTLATVNGWLFWRGSWMAYPWIITLYGAAIGLAAGWTYHRTGKVTASAVTNMLIVWLLLILLS